MSWSPSQQPHLSPIASSSSGRAILNKIPELEQMKHPAPLVLPSHVQQPKPAASIYQPPASFFSTPAPSAPSVPPSVSSEKAVRARELAAKLRAMGAVDEAAQLEKVALELENRELGA